MLHTAAMLLTWKHVVFVCLAGFSFFFFQSGLQDALQWGNGSQKLCPGVVIWVKQGYVIGEWGARPMDAGSQREELCPWQRSWGRRLQHTQRRDRASGNPLFPSIYPPNQSLPTLLLHALTYTSDFMGGCPPPLSEKELTYSSSQ